MRRLTEEGREKQADRFVRRELELGLENFILQGL